MSKDNDEKSVGSEGEKVTASAEKMTMRDKLSGAPVIDANGAGDSGQGNGGGAGGPKPQLTPAQIEQLMRMMAQKGMPGMPGQGAPGGQGPAAPKPPLYVRFLQGVIVAAKNSVVFVDRSINFIVKDKDLNRNDVVQSARAPILFGVYVMLLFVLVGGVWSSCAPLNSAAVAIGSVIPSSKRKVIQHHVGGTIKSIFVKQGDDVKAGDPIVEFDEFRARAEYESVLAEMLHADAEISRWTAERDNEQEIEFSEEFMKFSDLSSAQKVIKTQKELFKSRMSSYYSMIEALSKQHSQIEKGLEANKARKVTAAKMVSVISEQWKSTKQLFDKGFANKSQLLEVEAKKTQSEQELAQVDISIASEEQKLAANHAEMDLKKSQHFSEIAENLKRSEVGYWKAKEQYALMKDSLSKVIVRSPVDGKVIDMNVHTIGGVIGGGYTIAEVMPSNDMLMIEAKVDSKNIDAVHVGLECKIRFSAFKSRTSPTFKGRVVSLSPDIVNDNNKQGGGMGQQPPSYVAVIEIDMDDFNKIAKKKNLLLQAGMGAEVQIITGTRTLLQYLLAPLLDTMFYGFNEK